MQHVLGTNCIQSMLIELMMETVDTQEQTRFCMSIGLVQTKKKNNQGERRMQGRQQVGQGLRADLVLSGLLDALQYTKILERANTHTLD